jgi:uncharacterized protein DUF3999
MRPVLTVPVLVTLLLSVPVFGAERPEDYAYGTAVQTDGQDALYQLALPPAVYRGVVRRDLGDVRVFNGAGEMVPYAWQPRVTTEAHKAAPVPLKLFPIHGDERKGLDASSLRVERNAAGTIIRLDDRRTSTTRTLVAYLVDATTLDRPVRALDLDVAAPSSYTAKVNVEESDDLLAWRVVAADALLLSLEHQGQRLERRRVEFAARRPKYFRVSWTSMPPEARLTAVRAEPGDTSTDVARHWESLAGHALADKPGEYVVDAQGHFPVDRVRVELPEPNTVALLQLSSRDRTDDTWRPVTSATVYRLHRDGAELTAPAIAIETNGDRYWQVKVDQRGGGLGSGEPTLVLGWLPHAIVFVARGAPPFTLAYGRAGAQPAAYVIESVVPGYRPDTPIAARRATVDELAPATVLGGQRVLAGRLETKTWVLWASLVVGVAVLGLMAWRLVAQMKASGPSGRAS